MKKYGRATATTGFKPTAIQPSQFANHEKENKKLITDYFTVSTENHSTNQRCVKSSVVETNSPTTKARQQSFLDAGQKNFLFNECKDCGMKYDNSFESDVQLHRRHHRFHTRGMLVKVEQGNIIGRMKMYCAIAINQRQRKREIMELVNDKLNAVDLTGQESVFGVVDDKSRLCSVAIIDSDNAPGLRVSRIWTRADVRRQGLATFLLDSICKFEGKCREMIQFTSPTPLGRLFAQTYTKTDNFIIYK